jgi:hypothetical protein
LNLHHRQQTSLLCKLTSNGISSAAVGSIDFS